MVRTAVLVMTFIAAAWSGAEASPPADVIPKPAVADRHRGEFILTPETRILVEAKDDSLAPIGDYLASRLRTVTGFPWPEGNAAARSNVIRLGGSRSAGPEGSYTLVCDERGVTIRAGSPAGVFYGVQTLLQLLPPEITGDAVAARVRWAVPHIAIDDAPRFPWRGMHLDVGRHFFPVAFIKNYIDLLAAYKMNVFHWHLTDDQGWRIEIKKYPRLTGVGSRRKETMGDCTPHAGFYTQEEIRDVVEYARQRFITVVPEIEMPGHSLAALAAYPELSCSGGPFEVGTEWGVVNDVCCAGNDKTFEFLENVIDEVVRLFPGPYVHVGGDECPKLRWRNCVKCQARIRAEGLHDELELQSYFMKRIEKILAARGKRMVGWDEILEGGLAPDATVMSWRGTEGGIAAARSGHDVVMTPTSNCYFDYDQGVEGEPRATGGHLPLENVYNFDPVPDGLGGREARHILGAQGNVWTEWMPTTSQVEYMVLPRMLAMSEVLWSPAGERKLSDFLRRLETHYDRFAVQGLRFRVPTPAGIGGKKIIFGPGSATIGTPVERGTVYYTVDGSEPTAASQKYAGPVPVGDRSVLKAILVLPDGSTSNPVTTTYVLVDKRTNGLRYRYYEGTWDSLPDFSALRPLRSGTVYDIDLNLLPHREDAFGVELEGFLNIPDTGTYTFFLASDDGSRLYLDGKLLVDHNGLHGATEKSAAAVLAAGKHTIRIQQFERGGDQSLALAIEGPGMPKQPVPPAMLMLR